jgi:quercetin dioxygenase-like cupin family protein
MGIKLYREAAPVTMLPGIVRKTLVEGEKMMICEFTLEAGSEIPTHSHSHEQVGYILEGRLRLTIGGESRLVGPGDSYAAPPNVPHHAQVFERAIVIDTFSPPREDYRS